MRLKLLLFCLLTFVGTLIACLLETIGLQVAAFAYIYLVFLPLSWFCWVVLLLTYRTKIDLAYCAYSWTFCAMTLLGLLKISSLFDPHLASSRGSDLVLAISNAPAILPFGGYISLGLDSLINDEIFSINKLVLPDYQKLWIEVMYMSVLQCVAIVVIRSAFKKVLDYYE